MADLFRREVNLTDFYMEVEKKSGGKDEYPISSLVLEAQVGALPMCDVTIMQGFNPLNSKREAVKSTDVTVGDRATVYVKFNDSKKDHKRILMCGRIGGVTHGFSIAPASVQTRFNYTIMTKAAFLDSIPTGAMYFVSNGEGDPDDEVSKNAFNMSRGALSSKVTKDSGDKAETNFAKVAIQMYDAIGAEDKDQKATKAPLLLAEAIDPSTCPEMKIAFPTNNPLAEEMERDILQNVGNQVVYPSFLNMIRSMYLDVAPNFYNDEEESGFEFMEGENKKYRPGEGMKVIAAIQWLKKASFDLKAEQVLAVNHVIHGKGRNEIDGIGVKYTLGTSGTLSQGPSESISGTAIYAEGISDSGKPKLVKDEKDLEKLRGTKYQPPHRLLMMPLPRWVNFGMCNVITEVKTEQNTDKPDGQNPAPASKTTDVKDEQDWAKKWANGMAQLTFCQMNRSNHKMTIQVPFITYLNMRNMLGEVISAFVPYEMSSDSMIDSAKRDKMFGYLSGWRLQMELGWDRLNINAMITLTHVRNEEENDELGLEDNEIYDEPRKRPKASNDA